MAGANWPSCLKEKGELLTTKKMYDNQLPEWVTELVHIHGSYDSTRKHSTC